MDARSALLPPLMLLFLLPGAAALPIPSALDTCLTAPLATCVDSIHPSVEASRLLPSMMVPDPEPQAAPPAAASQAEPTLAQDRSGARPAVWGLLAQMAWLWVVGVLAALVVALSVMLVAARRRREPQRARLSDAWRAHTMQADIDAAWREARARPTDAQRAVDQPM